MKIFTKMMSLMMVLILPLSLVFGQADPVKIKPVSKTVKSEAKSQSGIKTKAGLSLGMAPKNLSNPTLNYSSSNLKSVLDGSVAYGNNVEASNFYSFNTDAPTVVTVIGSTTYSAFSGDFAPGDVDNMYIIDYNDDVLKMVDIATGVATSLVSVPCPMAGTGGIWTELAIDKNDGTFYATATDITASNLYTIDPGTGAITLVGSTGIAAVISCTIDLSGVMYAFDIVSDNTYTINLSTGAGTLLGPAGFAGNYAQGMGYDAANDIVYLAAYSASAELRTLNTTTGATTFVAALPGETGAFGFPYQGGPTAGIDVGVQSFLSPVSGPYLGDETVTIKVKNFGTDPASNIPVSYTLDGGLAVNGTLAGPIASGATAEFTFPGTVDLSNPGQTYVFVGCTALTGDENSGNDCKTANITNVIPTYCDASTTTQDEYISNVLCGDINNSSGWQGGVADYTAISTTIDPGMSENITVTNATPYTTDATTCWVDWNMDYTFGTGEEQFVLTDAGGLGATFTGAITVPVGTPGGDYRMRVRLVYNAAPVPCGSSTYGEVEDYTIHVSGGSNPNAIFSDDFEAYTAGQQLACQNPTEWTTWSNAPCGTEDPFISDLYAYSGVNSAVIAQNNDLVKDFGDPYTSGKYSISFYGYIPTGSTGYFNTLQTFTGATQVWGLEVYFNAAGAGSINAGGTGTATFTWTPDTWFQVEHIIDLDMDMSEIWIDGNMIYSYQWSLGATGTGVNSLEANDFFGATANDHFYIDDYTLATVPVTPPDPPTNLVATVADNDVHLSWQAPGGGGGNEFVEGFEGGSLPTGWMAIDNDGDGFNWINTIEQGFGFDAHTGSGAMTSASYDNTVGPLTPDNWLITPPINVTSNSELTYWHDAQDPLYAAEQYYVRVSTTGTALSDFTETIWSGITTPDWSEVTVSLASFAGQTIYIAWNHTDVTDMFWMKIDDVTVTNTQTKAAASPVITNNTINGYPFKTAGLTQAQIEEKLAVYNAIPDGTKDLLGYNVYRDGAMINYTTETQYDDMNLDPGTYEYYVTAVYDEGESDPSNMVTAIIAGAGEFTDDFETYVAGQQVACQNPVDWTTWSNAPCGTEDAYVSTEQAYSGVNSAVIEGVNDLVHVMPNFTTGKYTLSFMMYIPSGYVGYFNTLQDFAGASSQWGMQAYFELGGAASVDAGAAGAATFIFPYDTWMSHEMIIDLTNDWAEYYVDGSLIVSWVWSGGTFGTGTLDQLGGNDFYAYTGAGGTDTPKYFIDDYSIVETPIGIENHFVDQINAYPNPARDLVNIKSDNTITKVNVYNYTGQMVKSEKVDNNVYQVNTSAFNSGIYFFQIETAQGVTTKRIVIE